LAAPVGVGERRSPVPVCRAAGLRTWALRTALKSVREDLAAVPVRGRSVTLGRLRRTRCYAVWIPMQASGMPTALTPAAVDAMITKAEGAADAVAKSAAAFGTSAHDVIDQCVLSNDVSRPSRRVLLLSVPSS
jgi:hypothetical protein